MRSDLAPALRRGHRDRTLGARPPAAPPAAPESYTFTAPEGLANSDIVFELAVSDGTNRVHAADGTPVIPMTLLGTFSPYMVVHKSSVVKIDPSIPFEVACLVGCGVTTGMGAVMGSKNLKAIIVNGDKKNRPEPANKEADKEADKRVRKRAARG